MSDFAPSHWEYPPHEYEEQHERWEDRPVIICDVDDCDWVGPAFASQFALHSSRRHNMPDYDENGADGR